MKHLLSLAPLLLALAAVPAAAQQPRSLSIGQVVASQLEASDGTLQDGSPYETWTFQARAGQLLIISMGSDDFDTILVFGHESGGQFQEISTNDDSAGSTDSTIEYQVPRDGTYVIRATSYEKGDGAYTLIVFDAT
jgi:hypothetical protein